MLTPPFPPLVLTQGDPSSIAPEITVKAWQNLHHSGPVFVWIGDPTLLASSIPIQLVETIEEGKRIFTQALPVLPISLMAPAIAGQPCVDNAACVLESIYLATTLTLNGHACAMVTNPISKDILHRAGFQHPGHTSYLAELCHVPGQEVMMLVSSFLHPPLRVVPLTEHVSLRKAIDQITPELIILKARAVIHGLIRDFGLSHTPRLAIAALNPHAGENGLMGDEEQTIISPAIERLRSEGFIISDPLPADTLFTQEARQLYDVVLCMYHDQALIPIKTLDMAHSVNVTLGLPIIRTSPDHGTAFSLARESAKKNVGQSQADSRSLEAALHLAAQLSCHKATSPRYYSSLKS